MNKVDSNVVGAFIAEEASLKTLPGTPVWREIEANSFSDFGGEITTVARQPLNASRQKKKGTTTGVKASGGFVQDVTQNNLTRYLQGFMFADAHEKPATQPLNGTQIALTAVASPANTVAAASGLGVFKVGHLALASGFSNAGNNGLMKLTAVAAGLLTTSKTLVAEAAPPATAKIEAVGFEFVSGDASIVASASSIRLLSAAVDLTTLGLNPGGWLFIGGDSAGNKFANNVPGYARIAAVTAGYIEFNETTFPAVTDTGVGKTIQIYFGTMIRNEKNPLLIKRRSYQIERQLGMGSVGLQSEYVIGAVPNDLKLTIPKKDKVTVDLSFVAMDAEYRDGSDADGTDAGQAVKAGTRIAALGEDAFNSSSDIYRFQMSIFDPLNLNKAPLFGYVSEASIEVKNGVTANEAIGVLGAFDTSAGDFDVSGSVTAFFTDVAAIAAIRNNANVSLNLIATQNNAGFVVDVPQVTLGGGRLDIKKDSPIMIPLKTEAAESTLGYTAATTWFAYLPSVGMSE